VEAVSVAGIWTGSTLEVDWAQARKMASALPIGPVVVKISRFRQRRSNYANRFYFSAVVTPLAGHLGYEVQEMHEVLAMRFLRIEDCPVTGSPRRKRTPTCNTKEFTDYVNACIRLAAELGVMVDGDSDAA
jgi:hypothetical protein